jgi:hypothetical protein
MLDRRQSARARAVLGGVAAINSSGSTMDCVVRNISEGGACVEFENVARLPEEMSLSIARKGRSFLARMVWGQANRVGLAFRTMTSLDFDERLRRSERKKRQLERRIKDLLGEG